MNRGDMSDLGFVPATASGAIPDDMLSLHPLTPAGLAEADARERGRHDYSYELPDEGTQQRRVWDNLVDDGVIDTSAVPGTASFPIFEKEGRAPPPPGAAWVDLAGQFHEPSGAYAYVGQDPIKEEPPEAPFSFLGTTKSLLSGMGGTVANGVVHALPLNPMALANDLDSAAGLVNWIARDTARISDDDFENNLRGVADFRHSLPRGLGYTTAELQDAAGFYHAPQNGYERRAEDIGALLPYLAIPEAAEVGGTLRMTNLAERAIMQRTGQLAAYDAGIAASRAYNAGRPIAATLLGREASERLGGDSVDQNAWASIAGGAAMRRARIGPVADRPGDRWKLDQMSPSERFDISTANLPPEAVPSTILAARQANALSYFTDGGVVTPTQGTLARASKAAARAERRAAELRGDPYKYQVGHSPDSTSSGEPYSIMPWIDQHPASNSKWGGMLAHRQGDRIRVNFVDGVPYGLPSPGDRSPFSALGAAVWRDPDRDGK
jgi:hypothetical protein